MQYPPAPKCPVHTVFMRFCLGRFPFRLYRCPQCRDWWVENGLRDGQVSVVQPTLSLLRSRQAQVMRSETAPCDHPHAGPGTTALAFLGGMALLSFLFGGSARES